jgi:hypothetical protein
LTRPLLPVILSDRIEESPSVARSHPMTKPTGRPKGRPKTKEYVTLMARVDVALAEQVRRYARLKRQTISDVLRDGLLVLLSEQDPWHPLGADTHEEAL